MRSVGRRTGRAELDEHAEGVHNSEIDVDLARSARSQGRSPRRHPRAAVGAAGVDQYRAADRAPPRPHAVGRAGADRAEDLRRRPGHAAAAGGDRCASVSPASRGLVDLQVEKQVLIPQVRIHLDYERAALYGMTPAAVSQALEAMSNGRRVSQIVEGNRRFDVVMRLADQDRSTTGLGDLLIATPSGPCAAAPAGRDRGRRRSQPDPARERAAPHRRLRQRRRPARHGRDHRRHPPRRGRDQLAAGLHHAARRHVPGAGRSGAADRRCCRCSRSRWSSSCSTAATIRPRWC